MIQFNLNRFGRVAKWSLRNDKRYYVKSFLQVFVVTLLLFLFFTTVVKMNGNYDGGYRSCVVAMVIMFCVTIAMGPAWMFYSMEGKHDMQTLMMLPASNFEKYLMRYSSFLILLPLYVVGPLLADLAQYLFHLVVGHDYGRLVVSVVWNDIIVNMLSDEISKPRFIGSMIATLLWIQSVYALGATLFRTRKFNWIITTVFLILLAFLLFQSLGKVEALQLNDHSSALDYAIGFGTYLVLTVFNYWLSYRLFCRTQVIGKFVNL